MTTFMPPLMGVRRSSVADAAALALQPSAEALREMECAGGHSPEQSLAYGLTASDQCLTVTDDTDAPIAMFGTIPFAEDPRVGGVWFIARDDIATYAPRLIRFARRFVESAGQRYAFLMTYSDQRNTGHHRFLRGCGFSIRSIVAGDIWPAYEVVKMGQSHV